MTGEVADMLAQCKRTKLFVLTGAPPSAQGDVLQPGEGFLTGVGVNVKDLLSSGRLVFLFGGP